jgi:hypothetical protein
MPDWKRQVLLAIPDSAEEHFLLLPTENEKWRLPSFDVEQIVVDMHLLQRRLLQDYQAEMSVLRWLVKRVEEGSSDIKHFRILALVENHKADWEIPEGAKWFDSKALSDLPLEEEWQREALIKALATIKDEAPAIRAPWFRNGWYQKAKRWIERELDNHGYPYTAVEQYKHWGLSALLRAETNRGLIFFKIANNFPLFAHEPKIMEKLSQLFPKFVPAPLAVNYPERWMLMPDFGKPVRESAPNKELLLRLARDYAKLQQETSSPDMHRILEEAGCFNRRLNILEQQIEPMFLDEMSYSALEAEEMSAWKACRPKLIALCQALAQYNIPHTLVHGDFHAGNVAFRGDDLLIFDWTDACIAHPFFDLPVYLDFDGGDNQDEIRQAYLAEWLSYEPMERLEQAYRLAELGAALHQVISYQGIYNGIEREQQDDWAGAVVYFIRKLIKALPELNL